MNESEIKNEVSTFVSTEIKVVDQQSYLDIMEAAKIAKQKQKQIDEYFEPMRKANYDALQAVYGKINEIKKPLEAFEKQCKLVAGQWYAQEQRRIAEENERRRIEAEAMLKLAAECEKSGENEMAFEATIEAMTPQVTQSAKATGVSHRSVYKAKVIDASKVPDMFKVVDLASLNNYAKGFKDKPNYVDGVEWIEEIITSVRG